MSVCKLASIVVPKMHQERDEIVVADELGAKVLGRGNGADIQTTSGSHLETKTSRITTKNTKTNFSWDLAKGYDKNKIPCKEKLLASVRDKTESEGALFRILDGVGHEVKRYSFSHKFLMALFAEVPLDGRETINFGCMRCDHCGSFHRLDNFKRYEQDFEKGLLPAGDKKWQELFTVQIASQCK